MLSNSLPPPGSTATPHANFRGQWRTLFALLLFHITIVVAAISLTPHDYYFRLGESTGLALVLSTVILWGLLLSARTRRAITIFCVLALGQAAVMALVALSFRAEDRALRPIFEEIRIQRKGWESEAGQFDMDPLLEMISGKRTLSVVELRELQTRARAGKAKISEVQGEVIRTVAEAEQRIGGLNSRAARDFRSGFETTRPAFEEQMKLMQDYYTATDQLAEFLIHRHGQYSQTPNGLVFTRVGDTEAFNRQVDAISHLQEQMNSIRGHYLQKPAREATDE